MIGALEQDQLAGEELVELCDGEKAGLLRTQRHYQQGMRLPFQIWRRSTTPVLHRSSV
jgi:hypothetical protein